jgi:hypothetical protein
VRSPGELGVHALDLGHHCGRTVDGVRAVVGTSCVTSGSVHLDPYVGGAAGPDDGLQVGRLCGDTAEKRRGLTGDVCADAEAVLLLVDDRRQFDRAAQLRAAKRRHCRKAGSQTTFHVGRAAAIDATVVDGGMKRILRPPLADRDYVGVAEQ